MIFRLPPLTSAAKTNQQSVNQKLCNTILILDALYYIGTGLKYYFIDIYKTYPSPALDPSEGALPSRTSDGFELGSIGSL